MDDFFIPDNPKSQSNSQQYDDFFIPDKKRTGIQKAGRIGAQLALGAAENALLPYELGVAPLASKEAQMVPYRENLFADIERLQEQKQMGLWDDQDQALYDSLIEQVKNPGKAEEFVKTADIGVRGLAEKATGLDLQPEGVLEKAANWKGFITKPKNIANLSKSLVQNGLQPKQVLKSIAPGADTFRSLGAGLGLEIAEGGGFGPIGTMTSAIIGDVIGGGAAGLAKGLSSPKKFLAESSAKLIPAEKLELQKNLIKEFQEAGLQADIGTITDSNLLKVLQARLAQSGLTGEALDNLKKKLTTDIEEQYGKLAESLGEARFQGLHEAGTIGKEHLKSIRDAEKLRIGKIYESARGRINEKSMVIPHNLAQSIKEIEKSLSPGSLKSPEMKSVLEVLDTLKKDVMESSGKAKKTSVQDLMNNKIALRDIVDFEVQGGQKKLLEKLIKDMDRAIVSYGAQDQKFLKEYVKANEDFAKHAKTFRNPSIDRILRSDDPMTLMNKMNSVQGIRELQNALGITPEGRKVFGDLKRAKFDQMMLDKMTDNVSHQIKLGTFSNALKNPKNRDLAKELLGPESFKRLERLQKLSGELQNTAQKFFNASKSGTTIFDTVLVGKGLAAITSLLNGNPWTALSLGSPIFAMRYLTKLFGDPKFLKEIEQVVLASKKNDIPKMLQIGKRLEGPMKAIIKNPKDLSYHSEE